MKKLQLVLTKYRIIIFPSVLLVLLISLTLFRISGTSIGIYHDFLYGETKHDPNLLFGHPQSVRSDEWLVNTQLTIAQSHENFPEINYNFLDGKDMSVTFDVPYRDWSTLFKPQNLSFFIMPLEHALAFKWWLMLFGLIASAYFFILKLLPGKVTIAILGSLLISCSPFVFWWWQTNILAYGFLIILISMSMIDRKNISFFKMRFKSKSSMLIKISILSYLLVCFALTLYPPFQVPVALVVAILMLGYAVQHYPGSPKQFMKLLLPFIIAISLSATICGIYIGTRSSEVQTIANTVYPGKRSAESGGYDIKKLLVTYLQPGLQDRLHGPKYDTNQSESSSFILMPLFFIAPIIVLLSWIYKTKRKIEWILLAILACMGIFLIHMFIPHSGIISKSFLLTFVPQSRLVIGLGFISIILIVYLMRLFAEYKIKLSRAAISACVIYTLFFLFLTIWSGLETARLYPDFIASKKIIFTLAAVLILGQFLLLIGKHRLGLFILALFSVMSIVNVNPLYIGLGPFYHSNIRSDIQSLSNENDTWAAADNIILENLPQMSDRHALTGVSGYPSLKFWHESTGIQNENIYNRYAHIFSTANNSQALILLAPDLFAVSLDCSRKIVHKVDYVISTTPLPGTCRTLIKETIYPKTTFYIYKQ